MLEAIYHPSYVPNSSWYKTQLLVWDKIYRIVPYSVEKSFGASKLASDWDIEENLVPTKDINMPSHRYFDNRKEIIVNQFKKFSEIKSSHFTDKDYFYLNTAKVPRWIVDELNKYKLRKEYSIDEWESKHYLVRSDVSDFIMSCIAHNFNLEQGFSPLTDRKASYFATYGNQIGERNFQQPVGDNFSSFITGVFDIMVPSNVNKLTFKDIKEIRDEYKELREAMRDVLVAIANELKLDQIIEKNRAEELIKQAVENFNKKIEQFDKQKWRHIISDWKTQSLATFLGAYAGYLAGGPRVAIALVVGSASIQILNQIVQKNQTNPIKSSRQYFSKVGEKIYMKNLITEANEYYAQISPKYRIR